MNHRLLSSNKLLGNVEPKKLLILVLHRKQVNSTTDMAKVRIILRILIFIGRLFAQGEMRKLFFSCYLTQLATISSPFVK